MWVRRCAQCFIVGDCVALFKGALAYVWGDMRHITAVFHNLFCFAMLLCFHVYCSLTGGVILWGEFWFLAYSI
jgi:hypothetical protein